MKSANIAIASYVFIAAMLCLIVYGLYKAGREAWEEETLPAITKQERHSTLLRTCADNTNTIRLDIPECAAFARYIVAEANRNEGSFK
jgi:hypothetical protein